jgi:hypothetical protein
MKHGQCARCVELARERDVLVKALENILQRLSGPADAQIWDIRKIVDSARIVVGGPLR